MPSRTLFILKPDCVERGLIGLVLAWLERCGLKIVAMKMETHDEVMWGMHYVEHLDKPFAPALLAFMSSGPGVLGVAEHAGPEAYKVLREAMGGFAEPRMKTPPTIRSCFMVVGECTIRNIIHGSDSPDSAAREIALWFPEHATHVEGEVRAEAG